MNLKKQILISLFAILTIMSCGKKEAVQNEDQDEMSKEKNNKRKSGNKVDENRGLKLF